VLLDEPRNSLDQEGFEMLASAVGDVQRRSGSVIWCSPLGEHQPVDFDAALLLEDGELRPV